MATPIQSVDWVPQFSADSGTTWLTVICPTSWTVSGSSDVTKTSTLTCGVLQSTGSAGYECSADAVSATDPSASQTSVKQLLTWFNSGTALEFKATSGVAGADLYLAGDSRISSLEIQSESDNYVTFSISWTVENADITPA